MKEKHMPDEKVQLDLAQIKRLIPHRYPFLFVDKVIEIRENSLTGIKNITQNEWFFQGHFPDYPVMPGVLQIEALAQASALLVIHKYELQNKPLYFLSMDKVKFRSQVVPGDVLYLEVEFMRFGGKISKCKGKALVNGKVSAEAEMTAMIDYDE
jgi:3-hydroxyacyl-[acyl-carrier-protein] dehydratase